MNSDIHCTADALLPKLTWIAKIDGSTNSVHAICGPWVEHGPDFLVEGVWDGPFDEGNFDTSASFFGSGLRVRESSVILCPSRALVDRIYFCETNQAFLASNSLIALLSATGAKLDTNHSYHSESESILQGVNRYKRKFRVEHESIKHFFQIYYENVVIENNSARFEKAAKDHIFGTYQEYRDKLDQSLSRILDNAGSDDRTHKLQAFSTLSSGYDATAVTALAKQLGVTTCFGAGKLKTRLGRWLPLNKSGDKPDTIAKSLNMNLIKLSVKQEDISEDEAYFLATNRPKFPNKWCLTQVSLEPMVKWLAASDTPSLVMTGYHGDKVWDVNVTDKFVNNEIIRGDMSGFSLTEARLRAGFINMPIPFLFAENIAQLRDISCSDEMSNWRLYNDYDRPIPRRIAEEAGVPRESFGFEKAHVSSMLIWPVNKKLRRDFLLHLREKHGISPFRVRMIRVLLIVDNLLLAAFPKSRMLTQKLELKKYLDEIRFLMWIWSNDILVDKLNHSTEIIRNDVKN